MVTRNGGPEVLRVEERPDPSPGAGEVRIDVRAAGVNFADLMARSGIYPDAPPLPAIVGYEVAGVVDEVGDGVEEFAPGDRVLAATRFGGYASVVVVPVGSVVAIPDSLEFEQAAAIPVNYATAHAAAIRMGGLREGDRILIHAAAGGVGIAAIQLARLTGAEIFGTASASKHDAIRAQGCDHPIDYHERDFAEEVMRLTDGEGVDVVLDAIGPSSFRRSYRVLRPGGRLVMFGMAEVQTGPKRDLGALFKGLASMPLATVPWWKSLALMNENKGIFGLNVLKWWDDEGLGRLLPPLRELLAEDKLKPVVAASFPFEEAGAAHRYLEERSNVGKVVLTP